MPLIEFGDFSGGATPDIYGHKQKPNAASVLRNYRSWRSALTKIGGQQVVIDPMPLTDPTLLDFWRFPFSQETAYFISAKGGHVWKTSPNGTSAEITGTPNPYVNQTNNVDPTNYPIGAPLTDTVVWTSTQLFGGLTYVLSNPDSTPQFVTTSPQISPAGQLQDLPGWLWNTPGDPNPYVARSAAIVRAFDNQLWAGNIIMKRQDGTLEYYPNLILYSDKSTNPANTYQNYIPDTWQPSSGTSGTASNWAGFSSLNTSDPIVDMLPLRDTLLVFTTNRTYVVPKLSAPQASLSPQIISTVRGLLSNDCACSYDGNVVMLTTDDIVITTGASIDFQSLANLKVKDRLFQTLLTRNSDWQKNSYVRYNRYYNEIWVVFPSIYSPDGKCDYGLIWDVESQSWSETEMAPHYSLVYAPVIGDGGRNTDRNWIRNTFNLSYNRFQYQYQNQLLAQDVGYSRPWQVTPDYTTEYVKIVDLEDFGAQADKIKMLSQVFFFINGGEFVAGSGLLEMTVKVVFSNIPFAYGIDWDNPDYVGTFTVVEDYKLDLQRPGRYVALQFTTNDTLYHELTSFDINVEIMGRRG